MLTIHAFQSFIASDLLVNIGKILDATVDISGTGSNNVDLTNVKVFYKEPSPQKLRHAVNTFIDNGFAYNGNFNQDRLIFTYGESMTTKYPVMIRILKDDEMISRAYISSPEQIQDVIEKYNAYYHINYDLRIEIEGLPFYNLAVWKADRETDEDL